MHCCSTLETVELVSVDIIVLFAVNLNLLFWNSPNYFVCT